MLIVDKPIDRPMPEFSGRRVFIVGSGPSLDRLDLGLLRGHLIFALNAAITLFTDRRVYPDGYWVLRDRRVIPEVMPRLKGWSPVRVITTDRGYDAVRSSARAPIHAYTYNENSVVHARTVAEDALQIARRAGCSDAVLVGVDCHAPPGQPYARALSWKPCAWYDPASPPADGAESRACASMLRALQALSTSGRLDGFPVSTTSATCPAFPLVEYSSAVALGSARAV